MIVIANEGEKVGDIGFVVESGNGRLTVAGGETGLGADHCGGKNYAGERLSSMHEVPRYC